MAAQLASLNPHWSDETIFQETRHINVALLQHITFNEFLPMVMGKQGLYDHDLVLYTDGYYDGYDHTIDPGAAQGFTTAAYRLVSHTWIYLKELKIEIIGIDFFIYGYMQTRKN